MRSSGQWGWLRRHPRPVWVLIETGANQRYIFGTNKRRANIGASHLVHLVGTQWAAAAARRAEQAAGVPCRLVQQASGKAILLAGDDHVGRAAIAHVTRQALEDAPGLGVWGVTSPVNHKAEDRGIKALFDAMGRARADGDPPELRFRMFPFAEPCRHTGQPAAVTGLEARPEKGQPVPEEQAWSSQFNAVFAVGPGADAAAPSRAGLRRLAAIARAGGATGAVPLSLSAGAPGTDPVLNTGWIAIVHADGNGIGNLVQHMGKGVDLPTLAGDLGGFSRALDRATRTALGTAAAGAAAKFRERSGHAELPTGWLLPVIVGGDDVTVIIDGRMALDFTEQFLRDFQRCTNQDQAIAATNARVNGADAPPVTASAGIAFIKPHHPFSDGYELAEQLCGSAKRATQMHANAAALDFHVLHDSVGRDLDVLRDIRRSSDPAGMDLRLWSGPLLLDGSADHPAVADLRDKVALVSRTTGSISGSAAHALRTAVVRGGPGIAAAVAQAVKWGAPETGARGLASDGGRSWLLDALDLDQVERGAQR